jgi:hypothetical protein
MPRAFNALLTPPTLTPTLPLPPCPVRAGSLEDELVEVELPGGGGKGGGGGGDGFVIQVGVGGGGGRRARGHTTAP